MIARVFPRRTAATPTDALTFTDAPPMLALPDGINEVHISVAFTYDMPRAEWLEKQWRALGVPVKMGGPAFSEPGVEFMPGMYLKHGYTITSRGCPNRCWFCKVPEREGYQLRELPIRGGWIVQDDNLLACSEAHIREVFAMLERQPKRPVFSGGLEAKLLKPWHAEALKKINPARMYFAYDTPDDYEPLIEAGKLLRQAGFSPHSHAPACYVLIGYRGDTFEKAETRLRQTIRAGFMPFSMLYRDEAGKTDPAWQRFHREWCRPQIVGAKMREVRGA